LKLPYKVFAGGTSIVAVAFEVYHLFLFIANACTVTRLQALGVTPHET
jgi:hypothetical protein